MVQVAAGPQLSRPPRHGAGDRWLVQQRRLAGRLDPRPRMLHLGQSSGTASLGPKRYFLSCRCRTGRRGRTNSKPCGAGRGLDCARDGAVSVSLEAQPGEGKKLFARLKADYLALGACLKEEVVRRFERSPFCAIEYEKKNKGRNAPKQGAALSKNGGFCEAERVQFRPSFGPSTPSRISHARKLGRSNPCLQL
jgi:hypothetical protein